MTKLIFLNAKINEITKTDEMKSEYRDAANVRFEKIVMLTNMTVNNKEDKEKNDATDNDEEK